MGLFIGALGSGCAREGDELTIVSPWSEPERDLLATAFRRWAEANPAVATGPVRIHWIPLAPGDDPTRAVRRRVPPDLLLGGAAAVYHRLARSRWLIPIERTAHPPWCVARRVPIGLAINLKVFQAATATATATARRPPDLEASSRNAPRPELLAFDDFRRDPVALAWAKGELTAGSWAEGYARLVRDAGHPRRIGRQAGAAMAAVERGEAAMTPIPAPTPGGQSARPDALVFQEVEDAAEWVEGVAVVRGGSHPSLAQEFVRFLADRGQAETPSSCDLKDDPAVDPLLADLLGATLVDAQDELRAAWARLRAAGLPDRAVRWMTEPPPWPPASIARMIEQGEHGGTLLDTLTGELAPEPDVRAYLSRSWLAPPRMVDGALLDELTRAVDGRLMREPRFRAWLCGEWTAWARQRYQRVARLAGAAVP